MSHNLTALFNFIRLTHGNKNVGILTQNWLKLHWYKRYSETFAPSWGSQGCTI